MATHDYFQALRQVVTVIASSLDPREVLARVTGRWRWANAAWTARC